MYSENYSKAYNFGNIFSILLFSGIPHEAPLLPPGEVPFLLGEEPGLTYCSHLHALIWKYARVLDNAFQTV